MIAVDSSAVLAMVLDEPGGPRCSLIVENADEVLISAGTLTEALIVAIGRRVEGELHQLLQRMKPTIVPVDEQTAYRVQRIYRIWGKGFHTAALNFGDCFAYDVARENNCPLLYVGDDFARTDIASAI